jgi:hypothetical protein
MPHHCVFRSGLPGRLAALALAAGLAACSSVALPPDKQPPLAVPATAPTDPANNLAEYPTALRVTFVQECVNVNGGAFALLYQCSCVIDRMSLKFTHDEFVEASTFAKYATLGGERGGEFRDPDRARSLTRLYRSEQAAAYKACNVTPVPPPRQ